MGRMYTIGHSLHKVDYFIELLKKYKIDFLLDVRSTPYSKFADQYNKENIQQILKMNKIHYSYMGNYFGARPADKILYRDEGYLDFEKVRKSQNFLKGVENVKKGLEQGHNITLMCTEKDPFDCHRTILVARGFQLNGILIENIMPDGSLQTQDTINQRLLDHYFPDRGQLSIFNYDNLKTDEELLEDAYKERNKEIGYHLRTE